MIQTPQPNGGQARHVRRTCHARQLASVPAAPKHWNHPREADHHRDPAFLTRPPISHAYKQGAAPMNEHQPRFDDTERQRALQEFQRLGEEAAAVANARATAVYPAFERSQALRRLLKAHRDYEELTDLLVEERDMARGSLDLAAMARRHLVALWDDPMRTAIADVMIAAMASQLVFEATLATEHRELPARADSEAMRAWLADAVQDLDG